MEIFSKDFNYTIKILSLLRNKGWLVTVREMENSGVPRSYSVRIMAGLLKRKAVDVKEGRKGGYSLLIAPDRALAGLFGASAIEKLREIGQGRLFAN